MQQFVKHVDLTFDLCYRNVTLQAEPQFSEQSRKHVVPRCVGWHQEGLKGLSWFENKT